MSESEEGKRSPESAKHGGPELADYFTRRGRAGPDIPDYFTRGLVSWPDILGIGRGWSHLIPEPWRRFIDEGAGTLRVEEFMDGGDFVVKAEIPGIDPDKDMDINVSEDALNIRAERRQESEASEKGYYRTELYYGTFSRTIPLPSGADESQVKATYSDGILEVRVPVKKGTGAKKVQITRG